MLAVLALLSLTACSDETEKPERPTRDRWRSGPAVPECMPTPAGDSITIEALLTNPDEKPLTIDKVSLTGGKNVELEDAFFDTRGGSSAVEDAVDATIHESKGGLAYRPLKLRLSQLDESDVASIEGVAVDYHNVDGRFRAVGATPTTIRRRCP